MAYVSQYWDHVNKPKVSTKEDKANLEGRAIVQDAVVNSYLIFAANVLKGKFGFSNPKKCEEINADIARSYANEKIRKNPKLSNEQNDIIKLCFLINSKEIVENLIIEAVLECRRKNGRYSEPLFKEQLKKTIRELCNVEVR